MKYPDGRGRALRPVAQRPPPEGCAARAARPSLPHLRRNPPEDDVDGGCTAGARHGSQPGPSPGRVWLPPGALALQPVRLEQPQPELRAGRERRHGVPEVVERDLADDGDRRRVERLRDLGPGDRRADDDAPLLVDDDAARCRARRARRTSRRRSRSSRRRRRARAAPPPPRAASVSPTAPTCGSVKITRGDAAPSERSRTSFPMIASAASRAWYFPMCVSSARPLTSPIA